MQTVTTVGYGDVTPTTKIGRIIAVFVMLEGIALLSIVTAAVTSTFVERARAAREQAENAEDQQEQARTTRASTISRPDSNACRRRWTR